MFKFFENLVDPYQAYTQTNTPPRKLWPFLRDYITPFRGVFAVTGTVSVANAVMDVGLIWYMGRIVDLLTTGSPADVLRLYWAEFLAVAVGVLLVKPLVGGLGVALLHNTILTNFGTMMRWRAHAHVLRQPVGWFEGDFAGRIANRIMQAPPAAGEAVFQTFDAVAFAASTVVVTAAMFGSADPILLVPLVIWLLGYAALMRWTVRRAGPASEASAEARSQVTGRVVDAYANIHSVKMFAQGGQELAYGRAAIEEARQTFMAEMRVVTKMDFALSLLNGFLIVAVSAWSMWLWYGGTASVGQVSVAVALVLRLNNMTYWIMWATTNLVQNLGTVQEGMQTITEPVTLTDAPNAPPLRFDRGEIALRGVVHHYGRGAGGLQGVDLRIGAGEKVGLVGRSGAGKSTLVKLLLRFYDPERGQVLIDGQDISQVGQDSLRAHIGMVQQDSSLLHRSVRDNILYGRPDAGEAALLAAAKKADAHDFILSLQDPEGRRGYDAHVGERGVKLSGG
ncbi:MAG: ABC transporter ATP-binding protein, partial [Cypionkella sp.]